MSNATGARFFALTFLVLGIAIGYMAAKSGFDGESVVAKDTSSNTRGGQQVQLAQATTRAPSNSTATAVEKEKTLMQRIAESPNSVPLDPDNPMLDVRTIFNDFKHNPQRDAGPIDIQRTSFGMSYQGIPTFFRLPVALTPEDLKSGKIDVAIMGASVDMSVGMRGTAFGPQAVRTGERVSLWGRPEVMEHMGHPHAGEIVWQTILNVVDYGDAPIDIQSQERSFPAVYKMVKEIADAGVIPVIVGGDHSLSYQNLVAITDVYGKGNVGVVHFDAHFDGEPGFFGHYISHGSWVKRIIDEGHVRGKNFIQVGLHSLSPGPEALAWMRENQMRYHMMAEIEERGWDAVMKDVFAEALDGPKKLFISIDYDCLEPGFAPGMGTPEPGGMTPMQLMTCVRGVAAQNDVVGVDLVEVNPLTDPSYVSSLVAVRTLGEALTGIAMNKKGINDPNYRDPKWKAHDVPFGN